MVQKLVQIFENFFPLIFQPSTSLILNSNRSIFGFLPTNPRKLERKAKRAIEKI